MSRRFSGGALALVIGWAVVVAFAVGGISAGVAAASSARGSENLSQAPAGLRAAVRRTLGVSSSSSGGPVQRAQLSASDAAPGDYFGYSVAISGSTAVIGAWGHNSGAGAAYVFVQSGGTWSEQAELTANVPSGNNFGYSVAISGSTVVVGAPNRNGHTGAAYVFVQSGDTWSQQARLTASDGAPGDYFGYSVAISGSTAVIGAYGHNSGAGAAYVFMQSGTVWSQQAELTAAESYALGWSVAISGSTAVIGAPSSGAAYVFVRSGSTWSQQAELTPEGGGVGYSVAISGSTAVIGAPDTNTPNYDTGAAYVFVRSGTAWSQQAELVPPAPGQCLECTYFGSSVSISGPTAVIGAWDDNQGKGAAFVFTPSGNTWSGRAELTASDGAAADAFGASVAISGSTAVIGAFGHNSNTGTAYLFGNV